MSGEEEQIERAYPLGPRPAIATRAVPPRPRRLSRRTLTLFAGGSAIGLAAALVFALRPASHAVPQEAVTVEHRQAPDLLASAPKDYSSVAAEKAAALGPPPVANAQPVPPSGLQPVDAPSSVGPAPVAGNQRAEAQRRRQQRDSARSSKLFATSGETSRSSPTTDQTPPVSPSGSDAAATTPPPPNADPQVRKAEFVAGAGRTPYINSGQLAAPPGRFTLTAGSTIAAALVTGLSSDLPGEVVAQVTEDVFDSATGTTKLIAQGSRLIGSYDAHVTYGQARALVIWTRLILPDGRSLDLDRLIGTDPSGHSGFTDKVNRHTGKLIEAGLLSTLFGVGTGLAASGGSNNDIAFAIRDSSGQSIERAGDKLVGHQLDVQPTITIRPGARVRVLVSRDLVLAPWPGT